MKLITEVYDDAKIEIIMEEGKKDLHIQGIFAQANIVNRNKRLYSKQAMESAIEKYNNDFVSKKRALGELNHPSRLTIDPERASHLITEMVWDGDNVIGKAKVLNTPMGNILRGLLESGVNIGVSTRGAGTVSMKEGVTHVGNDFILSTVDVVCDPSAPAAYVEAIMENVEWIFESGMWRMEKLEEAQKEIKTASKKELEAVSIKLWENFTNMLKK